MMCRKPYMKGILAYGCGQCMPCRVNRRRLWTHRILLESFMHEKSCFVTLTYDKEHLPEGNTLVPADLRNFFKRLRLRIAPHRIRYFGVGEYGENTSRPHYHAAVFGLGEEDSSEITSAWGKGHTLTGSLTKDSAQYICGYVTKKLTKLGDPLLGGRFPEFSRMSRRPGIGANAMSVIADSLTTDGGVRLLELKGDVPDRLSHARKEMCIGRYLKSKLRLLIGGEDASLQMQENSKNLHAAEMLEMLSLKNKNETFRSFLLAQGHQKVLNLQGKQNILNSKKGIL